MNSITGSSSARPGGSPPPAPTPAAHPPHTLEDPARYDLLFQRHLPGFTPSPTSYAIAEEALARVVDLLRSAGVSDQRDIDCIVAIAAGLMEAPLSNDPAGTRWTGHLNRLFGLYIDDAIERRSKHR